jgi:hypothetical protein
LALAESDAVVSGLTALAALALVVAALVLERACRTPDDHEPGGGRVSDLQSPG